jgi:hypothetical protein
MNGHVEKRASKTKGTRYRVLVFVDADHGGPRWETHGTFDREGQAHARLVKILDAYLAGSYRRTSRLTVADVVDDLGQKQGLIGRNLNPFVLPRPPSRWLLETGRPA